MKWQLGGDYPVGASLVPHGTTVIAVARNGEVVEPLTWNGIALPLPLPLNAVALDEEAALQMLRWYPEELWHQIKFVREIDRGAVMTRARYIARFGRTPTPTPTTPPSTTPAK
jgi:hypothetical protein